MIQTVDGPIEAEALGATLMHAHLLIGYPGWESDTVTPGPGRREMLAICKDKVAEVQQHGVATLLDPCPGDLGRDVELMAEVASATGLQIVCAAGLYKQSEGAHAYWHFRSNFEPIVDRMAELFEKELTEGIGDTGIRAGIIKVASGPGQITGYERQILEAAAKASVATGAPITTHTDQGTMGDEQQRILTEHGVPPHRIVIGHSCGTSDHAYHCRIAEGGSYLGFDRFGLEMLQPDAARTEALLALIRAGHGERVVVSHDSVWCWRGQPFPPAVYEAATRIWTPSHFFERIVPRLTLDNPRAFFAGASDA